MSSVFLQKVNRSSVESSATMFSISIWLSLWITIGVIVKIIWDSWYGFGAGFIIAPMFSIFLMWLFFARSGKKHEKLVQNGIRK